MCITHKAHMHCHHEKKISPDKNKIHTKPMTQITWETSPLWKHLKWTPIPNNKLESSASSWGPPKQSSFKENPDTYHWINPKGISQSEYHLGLMHFPNNFMMNVSSNLKKKKAPLLFNWGFRQASYPTHDMRYRMVHMVHSILHIAPASHNSSGRSASFLIRGEAEFNRAGVPWGRTCPSPHVSSDRQ